MKKLLSALFAIVLLAGCGATTPSKATKTCSMEQGPMKFEVVVEAPTEKDPVDFISMKINANLTDLGVSEEALKEVKNQITDEIGKQMKKELESILGVESGVKIDEARLDEQGLNVKVSLDLKEMKDQLPDGKAPSVEEFTKEIETSGFKCK